MTPNNRKKHAIIALREFYDRSKVIEGYQEKYILHKMEGEISRELMSIFLSS